MSRIRSQAGQLSARLPEVHELRSTATLAPDASPGELALLALAPAIIERSLEPVSVPSAAALLTLASTAERLVADPGAPPELREAMHAVRDLLSLRDEVSGRRRERFAS